MKLRLFIILYAVILCHSDDSDKSLFPRLPIAPTQSKDELCRSESSLYVESLNNLTLWAHKMWDATAKSTTGSLQGNRYQMGDWDECMKVDGPFITQYCLVYLETNISFLEPPRDPFALERDPLESVLKRIFSTNDISQVNRDVAEVGWCVPASCSLEDLETNLNDHLSKSQTLLIKHNVTYLAKMRQTFCNRQDEHKTFDMLDSVFCIVLGIFCFIVIMATIYEFKMEDKLTEKEKHKIQKHLGRRILIGFSARKNFLDLAKADESNPALRPLYGLRTFAIVMIIVGHRFGTFASGPVLNYDSIEERYRTLDGSIIFHGDLFVDTFFILSGLLVAYGLMVQYHKKYINPIFIIFLRYMRLTPLYAFVIFYYVTLLNFTGSGPLWKLIVTGESQDCKDNWWLNLLYVNNYIRDNHICLVQSWYLACDFHYFILAVFIILVFRENKKMGFGLFFLFFIASIAVPFIITLIYLRPGMLFFYTDFLRDPKNHPDFSFSYIKSHTRAAAYCVGMIAGYIYYRMKDKEARLSKLKSHFITLASVLLLIIGLVTGGALYNPYHEYNALEHAAFAGLHRLPWAFGTIGLLLTASFGHTKFLQKIFSWSPFIPLSRLVYGAFLMHLTILYRFLSMTTSSMNFDIFTLCTWAFGETVISFGMALVLYIIIETPIRKLFKEIFMSPRSTPSQTERFPRQDGISTISRRDTDSRL